MEAASSPVADVQSGWGLQHPPDLHDGHLHDHHLMDAAARHAMNEFARLAALGCDVPIALVSLFERQQQVSRPRRVMVIPDARLEASVADSPAVVANPGVVFYAAAPMIAPTGTTVGTLCIADHRPRELSDTQCQLLLGLAARAVEQLELRRDLRTLQHENATDPLTSLGNRRAFHERLERELSRAVTANRPVSLLLLDVDHFKSYNDSFGHPAGDVVLRQLAEVMQRTCRPQDFAARVGGEEFAVVLPGAAHESAFMIARWLRRRVQREAWPHRPVTVSVGVATAMPGAEGALQLAERADVALYHSKRNGRNCVTLAQGTAD